jgi:hypothetical protein
MWPNFALFYIKMQKKCQKICVCQKKAVLLHPLSEKIKLEGVFNPENLISKKRMAG